MSSHLRYRAESFSLVSGWRRWWPLAAQEFGMLFRSKWGVALFFLCLFPAVGRLVMMLILFGVVNIGPAARLRMQSRGSDGLAQLDPGKVDFYLELVLSTMPGMVFVLLLSAFVVSRSVARDRLANAHELYWTRGIRPLGYFFAKWFGSAGLIGLITVAAPFLLWVVAVFLAEDWSLLSESAPTVLLGLLGLALMTGVWTALCVMISACSATPNGATVAWSMLLVGSSAVGFVLGRVLREPALQSSLSVWDAGKVLVYSLVDRPLGDGSVMGAAALLSALLVALAVMTRRSFRDVEAVG